MIISLSILNIEKNERQDKIREFSGFSRNNWIHFDVMDGEFVENKTFKYEVVREIDEYNDLFKDVHLMTYNPDEYVIEYKNSGADSITFHYESVPKESVIDIINKIKKLNMKVGLSIKPSTNVIEIEEYLPYLDLILVMSVEPGKGGQKYLDSATEKLKWLKKHQCDNHYMISVDGGINNETSKIVKKAGADIIVVGTYLTKEKITKEKIDNLLS